MGGRKSEKEGRGRKREGRESRGGEAYEGRKEEVRRERGFFLQISQYEAVHPLRHWKDLKHRVGPNRRCFIFTHRAIPREPIMVLHAALTSQPSSSIQVFIVCLSVCLPACLSVWPHSQAFAVFVACSTKFILQATNTPKAWERGQSQVKLNFKNICNN